MKRKSTDEAARVRLFWEVRFQVKCHVGAFVDVHPADVAYGDDGRIMLPDGTFYLVPIPGAIDAYMAKRLQEYVETEMAISKLTGGV